MDKSLQQKALEHRYKHLNPMQQSAVFQIDGPLLILAGAGSGKTTVLINRIQYMVQLGNAYYSAQPTLDEKSQSILNNYISDQNENFASLLPILANHPIKSWNILAITFTNKAAEELRNRLSATLGEETAKDIQASTFHSLCMRILRRSIGDLGYEQNFTVYDTDDSLRVIKDGLKANQLDDKMFPPRAVLSSISRAKDDLTTPEEMLNASANDYRNSCIAKVYKYYQSTLKSANALDFDDIIVLTVHLFKKYPEVLEYYQNRYQYIMVDEYQDTNQAQYLLVSMLGEKHKNLCVVGDDDQSIYKFRGATIENILSFESQFDNTKVIRLEQNYRSTQNILTAANNLIANNTARKGKSLWTDAGEGEKILVVNVDDETNEAKYISDSIIETVEAGGSWNDSAILYRMNAQSSAIERALAQRAVPYRIIGGLRFYERKEIKDVVAYLSVLNNSGDDLRLNRIVNEPKRGIGLTTMAAANEVANALGESLFTVLSTADQYANLSRKSEALKGFSHMINELIEQVDNIPLDELLDLILDKTGYLKMLESEGKESIVRIENVMELKSNMIQYSENAEEPTLSGFLEEISLYTDLDNYDGGSDAVVLMTIHSAKGLEFPNVYIAGMEEGVFPGRNAQNFPEEIEEERRLAYVAITRAKKELVITHAQRRMLFGQTTYGKGSRFLKELPTEVIQHSSNLFSKSQATVTHYQKTGSSSVGSSIGVGKTKAPAANLPNLSVNDRVSHKIFGEGLILSAKPMGGDILLEIAFDRVGNKKVMATFAKLAKL